MAGGPSPFTNAFSNTPTGSFRYNTSQAGTALSIVYGVQRVSTNLLEYWGYSGSSGKGGKGGGGKSGGGKKGGNQATYAVDVAFGICQGPASFTGAPLAIGGNNRIWSNGGVAAGLGNIGLNGFAGDDGQAPDPVFASGDPNTPVIGYSGVCYVTGAPLQLGQSPALPNISFEITGFEAGTVGPNFPGDANPASIVEDLLTNTRYGAGFPSANLDSAGSLADFAAYCQAAQLAMSLLLDRPQPAARWLEEIATHTVAAVVWSGALLKIVPYATGSFSANDATWSPNLAPLYSVTDDDIVPWEGESRGAGTEGGTDPVIGSRSDPAEATNWLSLEYYDASNGYNPAIAPVFDQAAIDLYGIKTEPSIEAHCFTNATSAGISAQLQLNRRQAVRNQPFKFQLDWRYCLLEPTDIIEVTDTGAGLYQVPVRITSISETDNGELQIEAEELPGIAAGAPPVYPMQSSAGAPLGLFADPGDANPPIIFEPPAGLSGGTTAAWLLSSGGADWGGANVWVSTDGSTYALAGTIYAGARQGTLTADLASYGGANPDNTNTLSVDLTPSRGELVSASAGDAAAFITLCYCDGELLSYETATLTAANQYDVTVLYRGAYGTPPHLHSSGSTFAYVGLQADSPGLFKYAYPANLIGTTISIKLQSFNRFGGGLQDLASLTPTTYTLLGTGAAPTTVSGSYSGATTANLVVQRYVFAGSVTLPAGLAGSYGAAAVAATNSTSYAIKKNGTTVGTMDFAASGTTASFTMASATLFEAGDVLTVVAPGSPDATLANLAWTFVGS